jgi:hypothetical protein
LDLAFSNPELARAAFAGGTKKSVLSKYRLLITFSITAEETLKKKQQEEKIPAAVSFPMRSSKGAREAPAFPPAPSG